MVIMQSTSLRRARGALLAAFLIPGLSLACVRESSSQSAAPDQPAASEVASAASAAVGGPDTAVGSPLPAVDATEIALGSAIYTTTFTIDEQERRVTARRELERIGAGEDAILRLREVTTDTPGGGTTVTELAADTLRPRTRVTRQPNATADIDYRGGRVTGLIRAGEREFPVELELTAPAFGEAAALETAILGLPLAEGYRASLRSVEAGLQQRVRRWALTVVARETVEVPAGGFATFRVELEPADDTEGGKTLWVTRRAPRLLVRVENRLPPEFGGTVTTTTLTTAP